MGLGGELLFSSQLRLPMTEKRSISKMGICLGSGAVKMPFPTGTPFGAGDYGEVPFFPGAMVRHLANVTL
jgi:hypothetical protein